MALSFFVPTTTTGSRQTSTGATAATAHHLYKRRRRHVAKQKERALARIPPYQATDDEGRSSMAMSTSPHGPSVMDAHLPPMDYHGEYFPTHADQMGAEHGSPGMGDMSMESTVSRKQRGSSPGKRALQWFTRSRSNSPNNMAREPADPPSPSSFVVRNVVRQPGGVSQEASVDPSQHGTYRKVRSQPLHATSLGVPPGGPGGGTGYGTAMSSNDGRPEMATESSRSQRRRSQRSLRSERGRSASPARPASPGAIRAGAFHTATRISPGPLSARQQAEQESSPTRVSFDHKREQAQQRRVSANSLWQSRQRQQQDGEERLDDSSRPPSAPSGATLPRKKNSSDYRRAPDPMATTSVSPVSAHANESHSRFSMPVHIPHGSRLPPVIPIGNIPSPIKIPLTPSRVGASPLGSVSPAGSPGCMMSTQRERRDSGAAGSPGASAGRWFKGIFGRSPRNEEPDESIYRGPSPNGRDMMQTGALAWSDGLPLAGARSPLRDCEEAEAEACKRESMLMAARIEDEHRKRVMMEGWRQRPDMEMQSLSRPVPKQNGMYSPSKNLPHVQHAQTSRPHQSHSFAHDQSGRRGEHDAEWDSPRTKSPPGRKPAPRFSAHDLATMDDREREQVAHQVDPDDALSKLEGHLTPAQRIIAETRSKLHERERQENAAAPVDATNVLGQQSVNVVNGKQSSPSKLAHTGKKAVETLHARPTPIDSRQAEPVLPAKTSQTGKSAGMTAGTGPLPLEMPMGEALQEMMIRFYRFERYAVPLMRSLEARVVDVERDNQMAINADSLSADSRRDHEMDRWVGQMTGLMVHEISQLQAATREIRGARELIAVVVKRDAQYTLTQAQEAKKADELKQQGEESMSPTVVGKEVPQDISTFATETEKAETIKPTTAEEEAPKSQEPRRRSNFSSATFKSAVPPPATLQAERAAANASPNGRPRYTRALGQPLQNGKLSPLVSPVKDEDSNAFALPPLDLSVAEAPNRVGITPSRAPSDVSSSSHRAMSVDDRLKSLVSNSRRSVSPAFEVPASASSVVSDNAGGLRGHGELPVDTVVRREDSCRTQGSGRSFVSHSKETSGDGPQHPKTQSTASSHRTARALNRESSESEQKPFPPSSTLRVASPYSLTPQRRGSTSPGQLVPQTTGGSITTSSHASHGLRARAQSYLQQADTSGSGSNIAALGTTNGTGSPATAMSLPPSPTVSRLNKAADAAAKSTPTPASNPVSVLGARDLNAHIIVNHDTPSSDHRRSASSTLNGTGAGGGMRALDIKKSATSLASRATPASSTPTSNSSTPQRMSIKDRVAFFDSQRG